MAEEARRRAGKGTGQGGSESSHPFKGKGKGPGKAQQKGGKGKSGPGGGPATPSAVRLDPLLEAAYQLYIAGRRADQPRVSRNAWLRNNMRSDSALRAELRERMRAAHHAPRASTQPAAPQTGESVSTTPRQPPPPPRPRPRVTHDQREASSTAASSTDAPPAVPAPAQAESSTSSSSTEQQAHPPGPSPWSRRTARKTTSAKSAANAQHYTRAPVEPAYWEPAEMEAGAVSPASQALSEWDWPEPIKEEVGATPQEGFSMGSMATALQQASEEKPDCASPPDNPASPSRSEPQVETVESPTSPAVVEVCTETSQTPFQVQTATKVVDSTPLADERPTEQVPPERRNLPVPAGTAAGGTDHMEENEGASATPPGQEAHAAGEPEPPLATVGSAAVDATGAPRGSPPVQALGSLEVECREALRTQWLSFPFDPEEPAARTLARCRATASMASLNTLAVWPDGSELDLSLSLEESLRPNERRLLASGPADASVTAQEDRAEPSFEGKPITTPDGLTCLACGQRAPSMEHMSAHFMTAAHTRAVKAYMAQ